MNKISVLILGLILTSISIGYADDSYMKVDDDKAIISTTVENVVSISDLKDQRDKVEFLLNQTRVDLGKLQDMFDELNSKIEEIEKINVE